MGGRGAIVIVAGSKKFALCIIHFFGFLVQNFMHNSVKFINGYIVSGWKPVFLSNFHKLLTKYLPLLN